MVYRLDEGIKKLQDMCEQSDNLDRLQVTIQNRMMNGSYGPNLEGFLVDTDRQCITIEDCFSEVTFYFSEGMVDIEYDEELEATEFVFIEDGIEISLEDDMKLN